MKRKSTDIGQIEINPKILSGKPIVAGTRIPVELLLEFLANDWNPENILSEYPTLHKKDIRAAINYASQRIKQEEIHFIPTPKYSQRKRLSV